MFEIARVKCIENVVEKRRNCSLGTISSLFHNILLPVNRFRDKRLFEISEVEITRVDCKCSRKTPTDLLIKISL